MNWEYKTIKTYGPDAVSEYQLHELGSEGYELVACHRTWNDGHVLYFKRPVAFTSTLITSTLVDGCKQNVSTVASIVDGTKERV